MAEDETKRSGLRTVMPSETRRCVLRYFSLYDERDITFYSWIYKQPESFGSRAKGASIADVKLRKQVNDYKLSLERDQEKLQLELARNKFTTIRGRPLILHQILQESLDAEALRQQEPKPPASGPRTSKEVCTNKMSSNYAMMEYADIADTAGENELADFLRSPTRNSIRFHVSKFRRKKIHRIIDDDCSDCSNKLQHKSEGINDRVLVVTKIGPASSKQQTPHQDDYSEASTSKQSDSSKQNDKSSTQHEPPGSQWNKTAWTKPTRGKTKEKPEKQNVSNSSLKHQSPMVTRKVSIKPTKDDSDGWNSSDDDDSDDDSVGDTCNTHKNTKFSAIPTAVVDLKKPWVAFGTYGLWPKVIKQKITQVIDNGVPEDWVADAVTFKFNAIDPNNLIWCSTCKYSAKVAENGKAIYYMYPLFPGFMLDNLSDFLLDDPDPEIPDHPDTVAVAKVTKEMNDLIKAKCTIGTIRIVASNPNIRFTNNFFNGGERGANLTIHTVTQEQKIKNSETHREYGDHNTAWGYFTVGIVGSDTDITRCKKESEMDDDYDAHAKTWGGGSRRE